MSTAPSSTTITSCRLRGRAGVRVRAAFLAKHPLCAMCMKTGKLKPANAVDHVIPLFKGGHDVEGNKQSLCEPCHKLKTAADMGATRHPGCDITGSPIGSAW